MSGVVIDSTITLGNIATILVWIIGFVYTVARIMGRMDMMNLRLQGVEQAVKNTHVTDNRLATIEERVTNHVHMLVQFQKEVGELRQAVHADMSTMRTELATLHGWVKSQESAHE